MIDTHSENSTVAVMEQAPPSPAPASPRKASLGSALRRAFSQPRFVAVVLVLGVAAVGLNAASGYLQLHFRKQAVPLRCISLRDAKEGIPSEIGHAPHWPDMPWWVQISKDEPMPADMEQILGTKEHLSREYVDAGLLLDLINDPSKPQVSRSLLGETDMKDAPLASLHRGDPPQALLKLLNNVRELPPVERNRFIGLLGNISPQAVVTIGVTYYTGMVDTVAHIPDRCYVADGFEPSTYLTKEARCGKYADGRARDVKYSFIHFDDGSGRSRGSRFVGYLFHVNGHYESNPLDVRYRLQNLFEKYGYYAKVELMTGAGDMGGEAEQRATTAMNDFFTAVLPEVENRLPDWKKVEAGK